MQIEQLASAFIAAAGVFGSALVAYIISAKQARLAAEKLRLEIQATLGSRLYERRLETYPALYEQLSRLIKEIEANSVARAAVARCFETVQEWDSQHSILFGASTGKLAFRLRSELRQLLSQSEEELSKALASEGGQKSLRQRLAEFELGLKHELGVYQFESPATPREVARFLSYSDAQRDVRLRDEPTNDD
jgi:hypothetical protein